MEPEQTSQTASQIYNLAISIAEAATMRDYKDYIEQVGLFSKPLRKDRTLINPVDLYWPTIQVQLETPEEKRERLLKELAETNRELGIADGDDF